MTQGSWQDYLKLLNGLSKTLEQLAQVERDKNAAASEGNPLRVEECMKREQVLSLSLRGYDQKREAMLTALGMTGVPLSRLEEYSPAEIRLEARAAAEELRRQYDQFRVASQVARNTLEINLRAIEKLQAAQVGDAVQAEEERKNHQTDFRV